MDENTNYENYETENDGLSKEAAAGLAGIAFIGGTVALVLKEGGQKGYNWVKFKLAERKVVREIQKEEKAELELRVREKIEREKANEGSK